MLLSNVKEIEIPEGKVKQIAKGSEILWKKNSLTFVNAIIGTGTQFINLGKKIKQNYRFELLIQSTSLTNSTSNKIFGAKVESGNWPNGLSVLIYTGQNPYFYKNGYNYSQITKGFWESGRDFLFHNTDNSLVIDRVLNGSVAETVTVNVGGNLSRQCREAFLFSYNAEEGNEFQCGKFKFKSLKVYDENGVLVMDIVPAIDSEGVPCVVDLVDNRILYNAGTGVFGYE